MEVETVDAVVGEGGVLHAQVPFPVGTHVRIARRKLADLSREEWSALVHEVAGSIPDFDVPDDEPPRPIEPIHLD